ncbi:hypothetical protein EJ02DRAFT_2058 [Clathrospora elynae]|uniref:Uncharacterized protein n=1 Tax=Clathrospora elynae TaxID=706981 RepID=A0A6A5TFM0_9PLEO|nr:hypothetical protein EJ02DRAFT_2058 [Clathrospora elynae]
MGIHQGGGEPDLEPFLEPDKPVPTSQARFLHTLEVAASLILIRPRVYETRSWKIRKKLIIPMGTRRETASAFHQLRIGHSYNKAYLFWNTLAASC